MFRYIGGIDKKVPILPTFFADQGRCEEHESVAQQTKIHIHTNPFSDHPTGIHFPDTGQGPETGRQWMCGRGLSLLDLLRRLFVPDLTQNPGGGIALGQAVQPDFSAPFQHHLASDHLLHPVIPPLDQDSYST